MNDTQLTELARTEPPADPALRERVWERLQTTGAPVFPPAPRRWPRFALAGALALASGVALVALRPGTTPLAPAVAFAEVERAMAQIQTATWEEKSSHQKNATAYYLRQDPPSIAFRDNNGGVGTVVEDSRGRYSRSARGEMWIWSRKNNIQKRIRESLYFKDATIGPSDRPDLMRWRFSAWKKQEKNGFLEFTRESTVEFIPNKFTQSLGPQSPKKYLSIYLVDPRTNLIVRSESRLFGSKPGQNSTVRENFRYNVSLRPGVFEILPAIGKKTTFVDWSRFEDRVGDIRLMDISPDDRKAIQNVLNKLADAYTRRDWNNYLALRDTTSPPLGFSRGSTPEPELRESFENRTDRQAWQDVSLKSASYENDFQATRTSDSDPFPPANPKDRISAAATVRTTNASGTLTTKAIGIGLRKTSGVWRVCWMQFFDRKQGKKSRKQGF